MNNLWAPWRTDYIKHVRKDKGCLFCRILKSSKDKNNLVLFRTQHALVLLNLYPYNNGHLMVAPKRHIKSLELLKRYEMVDLMEAVRKVIRLLDTTLKPDGYNIGLNIGRVSGAGFDKHLHVHIVPRWWGDTNFMPTVADTKVISESLESLYYELIKNLQKTSMRPLRLKKNRQNKKSI